MLILKHSSAGRPMTALPSVLEVHATACDRLVFL